MIRPGTWPPDLPGRHVGRPPAQTGGDPDLDGAVRLLAQEVEGGGGHDNPVPSLLGPNGGPTIFGLIIRPDLRVK